MKLVGKILFSIPVLWICIVLTDGAITQYKAIYLGRVMCDRFLYGHHPEYGNNRPPAGYKDDGFYIYGIYDDIEWMRERTREDDLFDACTFRFQWRVKNDPGIGVLYLWLTKNDHAGKARTVLTGARVDHHFFFNEFLVWGIVYHTWGSLSSHKEQFDRGLTMWEESYGK